MFRKNFDPLYLKICNVFGKRNSKCCSQRFLKTSKDHKDLLLYCRTMAEQSLQFGTRASALILKG